MTDTTSTTDGYQAYVRFILRMYQLTKEGKFESDEAESARQEIEGVWSTLSDVEKQRLRGLSLDLKHLLKSDRNFDVQPEGGDEKESVVRKLRSEGLLDEALEFLRASQGDVFAPSVSALRALIWFDFQEADIANEFYHDALKLNGARVRSLVRSVSQELIKSIHLQFKISLHDVDVKVWSEFVREKIEDAGDQLTSILTEQQRRQEIELEEVLRSVRSANERSQTLAVSAAQHA